MTIRRQLTFSYFGILILLGCNLLIYLWADTKRELAFEDLRRAISRQTLISSIQQQLSKSLGAQQCKILGVEGRFGSHAVPSQGVLCRSSRAHRSSPPLTL